MDFAAAAAAAVVVAVVVVFRARAQARAVVVLAFFSAPHPVSKFDGVESLRVMAGQAASEAPADRAALAVLVAAGVRAAKSLHVAA